MKVEIIRALQDNYIYLIEDAKGHVVVVDPGESAPVLSALEGRTLSAILLTHHHFDHCDGVAQLRQYYPDAIIYAPEGCGFDNVVLCRGGDNIKILGLDSLSFTVIHTPGHTLEHIVYYGNEMLFSGDTLFVGGCGRVFEGTMQQMHESLMALNTLPAATQFYCGHEYTVNNLLFATAVEPQNAIITKKIQQVRDNLSKSMPSVPSTITNERQINPFLRTQHDDVIAAASKYKGYPLTNEVSVFVALRQWKNNF